MIQPLWRTVWRFLKKLKIELPYDPAIPLLGTYPEKTIIQKETRTTMFMAALFTTAKTWKQPKCPSTDEWKKKMWYGTSLVVQWLRLHTPNGGGTGSIPGWGTKIPHATQHAQKKPKKTKKQNKTKQNKKRCGICTYTVEYYPAIKKNEILPFVAKWMDLEIIILSEVSQTEKQILYDIYMWNLKKIIQIILLKNRNRLTDIENKLMVTKVERGGGGIN